MRAVLTGANGVFGVHILEGLLRKGVETHAVVREETKGAALQARLSALPGVDLALLHIHLADLNDTASIKALATALPSPLHILINNAAITTPTREEVHGIELQWSTNVLAYHRLTRALQPHLLAGGPSPGRVVFVASNYAGDLNLSDVEFKASPYCGDHAYRASKAANRMLSKTWSEKSPILCYSCHPGVATSNVSLGLGFDLDRSEAAAVAGSVTPLFLALSPPGALKNGGFYSDSKLKNCPFSSNAKACEELWGIVESYQ
jgi:NAD(P)-dependent dehydrogenase (short-subunit alcohol dehydrogenase family)